MNRFWNKLDRKYLKISAYALFTVLIGLFILLLCYNSRGFWVRIGKILGAVAKPLIYGLVITYLLLPVTNYFDKKLTHGQSQGAIASARRSLAVLITMLIVLLVIVVALTAVIFTFYNQVRNINFSSIDDYVRQLTQQYSKFSEEIIEFLKQQGLSSSAVTNYLQGAVGKVTGFMKDLVFGIIFAVYFLYDGHRISGYWRNLCNGLFNEKIIHSFKVFIKDADESFSGYIRGQAVDAFIVGVIVSITMMIAKVPYGALVGTLTGFGNMIPYFGPLLGYSMIILGCLFTQNFKAMIIGLILLAIIQALDANILNPRLLSNAIHIHPLYVMACVIAGGAMGGFVGMLIAVPLGALLKKEFERIIDFYKRRMTRNNN